MKMTDNLDNIVPEFQKQNLNVYFKSDHPSRGPIIKVTAIGHNIQPEPEPDYMVNL